VKRNPNFNSDEGMGLFYENFIIQCREQKWKEWTEFIVIIVELN